MTEIYDFRNYIRVAVLLSLFLTLNESRIWFWFAYIVIIAEYFFSACRLLIATTKYYRMVICFSWVPVLLSYLIIVVIANQIFENSPYLSIALGMSIPFSFLATIAAKMKNKENQRYYEPDKTWKPCED